MFPLRPALDVWILLASSFTLAGWATSLLHLFSPLGLTIGTAIVFTILGSLFLKPFPPLPPFSYPFQKSLRRFSRPLPALYLLLLLFSLAGALLNEPSNHDGLSYRIPRVLHWLSHGSWFWTNNPDMRMDTRSLGFEWLSAPFLALFHSDRLIFLWNWTSFLFLPGLAFQLSRRLGASARVAWNWMWLLPSAYGIVLQAGSIGNDSLAGVFLLAALALATAPSPHLHPFSNLALSALAMAFCTGLKATNILWTLPWICVIYPHLKILLRRPILSSVLFLLCLLLSSLPSWTANYLHCGDWTGQNMEKAATLSNPWVGLAGNSILFAIQTAAPPVWPFVRQTTDLVQHLIPSGLLPSLSQSFEGEFRDLTIRELPGEEGAGLGLGVSLLCTLSLIAALFPSQRSFSQRNSSLRLAWLAAVLATLIYFLKMAINCVARIILPGTMFLVLGFSCLPGQERLVRSFLWKMAALFAMLSALLVVALTPSRPVFPAPLIARFCQLVPLPSTIQDRIAVVYLTYSQRAHPFDPLLAKLPPQTAVLAYSGGAALEATLWKPYGQRQIIALRPESLLQSPLSPHPDFMIASAYIIKKNTGLEPLSWIQAVGAQIVDQQQITFQVAVGPELFYLLKLPPSPPPTP